ncbi:MAG: DUF4124 domain-containing protein, partial [Gammaproteobacteria bacterium]|nr:DUF4124 domain-containing protein [Gammaproteobacteria bacterium]
MRNVVPTTLTAAVLLLGAGAVLAERIMTWVDADGVRHFSQSPPTGPVEQLKTLDIEPAPTATADPARLDTIRAVASELEAARLQLLRQMGAPMFQTAPAFEPVSEPGTDGESLDDPAARLAIARRLRPELTEARLRL